MSLGPYDKLNLKATKRVVLQIELDMANGQFDHTSVKYGTLKFIGRYVAPMGELH